LNIAFLLLRTAPVDPNGQGLINLQLDLHPLLEFIKGIAEMVLKQVAEYTEFQIWSWSAAQPEVYETFDNPVIILIIDCL
jgi:hypothetical protein